MGENLLRSLKRFLGLLIFTVYCSGLISAYNSDRLLCEHLLSKVKPKQIMNTGQFASFLLISTESAMRWDFCRYLTLSSES